MLEKFFKNVDSQLETARQGDFGDQRDGISLDQAPTIPTLKERITTTLDKTILREIYLFLTELEK